MAGIKKALVQMTMKLRQILQLLRWNVVTMLLAVVGALAYNLPFALALGFEDYDLYSIGTAKLLSIGAVIAATSAYWIEFGRGERPAPDRRLGHSIRGPGPALILGGPLCWFYYSWGGVVIALLLTLATVSWLDRDLARRSSKQGSE